MMLSHSSQNIASSKRSNHTASTGNYQGGSNVIDNKENQPTQHSQSSGSIPPTPIASQKYNHFANGSGKPLSSNSGGHNAKQGNHSSSATNSSFLLTHLNGTISEESARGDKNHSFGARKGGSSGNNTTYLAGNTNF
jgi:hypothetical protein